MRARIIGLAAAMALALPTAFSHVSTASAQTAQFFVTGYVLTGLTASGTYTHPGTCAVDPRVIPLGSYFYVSGIGTCHAEDTGGAILGYRVDVWVPTVAQAYAITGWRTVTWGDESSQQALGSSATQPRSPVSSPAPIRQAVSPRVYAATTYGHGYPYAHADPGDMLAGRNWYSHGDSTVHSATHGDAVSGNLPAYSMSSLHG